MIVTSYVWTILLHSYAFGKVPGLPIASRDHRTIVTLVSFISRNFFNK